MPDEKRSYPKDTVILLAGPPEGKVMDVEFTVVEEVDKDTLRVKGVDGNIFRVHRSRVKKVVKEAESKPAESQNPEAPSGPVAEGPKEAAATASREKKGKEEEKTMEEVQVAAAPAPKAKPAPKPKAAKKEKVAKPKAPKKELVPFDLKAWAKGGTVLAKSAAFDHASHKLTCYIAVDAKGGFYHTINTYKRAGVESLGKDGKGGNAYPLKGHQITIKKKGKTEIHHGEFTAEEIIARKQKDGYKLVKI